jgi:hypothetical protein
MQAYNVLKAGTSDNFILYCVSKQYRNIHDEIE